MRRVGFAAALVLGILALGGGRSELAARSASKPEVRAHWEAELALGARERPGLRFENLPRSVFLKRLGQASALYNFDVLEVEFLRPKQVAPAVIVRSTNPLTFARDVPAVLRSIDPKVATNDDRTGWAWEGFYFEVRDAGHRPAIVTFNYWRSRSGGGGQWAADESLYPFPHG